VSNEGNFWEERGDKFSRGLDVVILGGSLQGEVAKHLILLLN